MNTTSLSSRKPSRATRILAAWNAWRAERGLTVERAAEASAFVTLILAWTVGYSLICPAEPARHATQHVAQVVR